MWIISTEAQGCIVHEVQGPIVCKAQGRIVREHTVYTNIIFNFVSTHALRVTSTVTPTY